MIHTDDDDDDDDYFNPIPSTSLASIFTKQHRTPNNEDTDNESLKYTPPKPQIPAKPAVESKATDCLFACALFAYEWSGDIYSAKGKVGLAIIRTTKNNNHDIVLYDSNKRTLSCASIKSHLEITVKGGHYVSYHDNFKKYWTIYATEEEIRKILDNLTSLNVKVIYCSHAVEEEPPEPNKTENVEKEREEVQKLNVDCKESDTDSSVNTRTKLSILNRMATMGQSVLPRKTILSGRTSDSSDNENIYSKVTKHKPTKAIVKRMSGVDKPQLASEYAPGATAIQTIAPQPPSNSIPLYTVAVNGQLVPLDNTAIRNESGSEINMIMSEQRFCNSELRINMGRLTDKMDQMLTKIRDLESNDTKKSSNSVESELYKKLISEYEYKIKMYEDMLFKDSITKTKICNVQSNEDKSEKNKDKEISSLKNQLATLKNQHDKIISTHSKIENDLRKEIANLKKTLTSKEDELINHPPTNITDNSSELEQKLKSVMNDTFHLISSNFENDDAYSGSTIKNVVGAIIKKVTLNSIKQ